MKKHFALFMIISIVIVMTNISNISAFKITNQEKFFLRLSEKYDEQLNKVWFEEISERENIIKEIKKNNKYEEYVDYINSLKKTKEYRMKNKYIRKLNYSVKNDDEEKIKRYLKLILNIFSEENEHIKIYFNIS